MPSSLSPKKSENKSFLTIPQIPDRLSLSSCTTRRRREVARRLRSQTGTCASTACSSLDSSVATGTDIDDQPLLDEPRIATTTTTKLSLPPSALHSGQASTTVTTATCPHWTERPKKRARLRSECCRDEIADDEPIVHRNRPLLSVYATAERQVPQNSVSKEALRRLARSWHLKSAASALDRLVDSQFGVSVSDPALCLALWKAAAYLAHENGSKTITLKLVERCIAINNILVEAT